MDLTIESTLEQVAEAMRKRGLPERMAHGVWMHLTQGIPPGDFLKALFDNDFMEIVGRADNENQACLARWALFLYNDLPMGTHGSSQQALAWRKAVRALREKEASDANS